MVALNKPLAMSTLPSKNGKPMDQTTNFINNLMLHQLVLLLANSDYLLVRLIHMAVEDSLEQLLLKEVSEQRQLLADLVRQLQLH